MEQSIKSVDNTQRLPNILIIGKGNVGTHLANAFSNVGFRVRNISSRCDSYQMENDDFIFIAVKDDAVGQVAGKLVNCLGLKSKPIIMHTSGSVPLQILTEILPEEYPCGVFYPMQTFSKDLSMRYDNIPLLIEASDNATFNEIKRLASKISGSILKADSKVRMAYHIGAVFACNFSNYLCSLSSRFLESNGLEFKYLLPLLEQTVSKLHHLTPQEAQTGPAIRGDKKVILQHLSQLKDQPDMARIYRMLSESINPEVFT